MAALRGEIRSDGKSASTTRNAHHTISVSAMTWDGEVRVALDKDGTYSVFVGNHPTKGGPSTCVHEGSVRERS